MTMDPLAPQSSPRLSRRAALRLGAISVVAVGLAACSSQQASSPGPLPTLAPNQQPGGATSAAASSAAPATSAATSSAAPATSAASAAAASNSGAAATGGKEAPVLAALVKSGKLPPVEQRLPQNPLVVKPYAAAGQYGGIWHTATTGVSDNAWMVRTMAYENLVRWSLDWKTILPNIAEKYDASPDGKVFTFTLRQGLKWSDGQPHTADDYIYNINDVQANKDLTPVFPNWLTSGGKNVQVSKTDDYTVVFTFDQPNGLFLQNLATPSGQGLAQPMHYLKQFNPKYGANNQAAIAKQQALVQAEAKRRGLQGDVATFYAIMSDYTLNPDMPVIYPWKATNPIGQGTRFTVERNPYYWKVDDQGRQLPYLDTIWYDLFQDPSTMVLRALAGDFDYHDRHFNNNQNKSVLFSGQQKGNYKLTDEIPESSNTVVIALNMTHTDPQMKKIFQDVRFRQALSMAINRKDAIDVIYVNQGIPYQPAPLKQSKFYDEAYSTEFTQLDVAKANSLLDAMGLTKKDGSGMRLRLDGKPLLIAVEVSNSLNPEWPSYLELVKKYWAAVGVNMSVKSEDRSIFYARKAANQHDAGVWGGAGGVGDEMLDPRWYFPFSNESIYAETWATWFQTNGQQGEEPPAATKQQMDLYNQIVQTGDSTKQDALMKQILTIAKDQFYAIGLSTPVNGYGILRNDFHNVPQSMFGAWLYPNPGPANPEQFFTTRKS